MRRAAPKITFEIWPSGLEWNIVATYPSGQKEHITRFKSELEAIKWMGSPDQLFWLAKCGYAMAASYARCTFRASV
jgi:hypothetical protein